MCAFVSEFAHVCVLVCVHVWIYIKVEINKS
jgi:hypothetical protein